MSPIDDGLAAPATMIDPMPRAAVLDELVASTGAMVEGLDELVSTESPTGDVDAVRRCAEVLDGLAQRVVGAGAEWVERDGRPHLLWEFGGDASVLIVGHFDTVWPSGTLARWPFSVDGDVATGPGCFDMKAGIVQVLFALGALGSRSGVRMLMTSDEETGSHSSRELIESCARGMRAALVLEPSSGGALKTARKGCSLYKLHISGRAAHAGLEPEKGANALLELAHQAIAVAELSRPADGTTVTPTVAAAGTTTNTVPAQAVLSIDGRAVTPDEQQRVDRELRALTPRLDGTRLALEGGPNRPPLPPAASAELFDRASKLAAALGLGDLAGVEVGGGSDGNFTAGLGVPTLDGLGAVGGNAHAEGEHVVVSAMPLRAALVASLIDDLRSSSG